MATSRFAADRQLSVRMVSVIALLAVAYAAAIGVLVAVLGKYWPLGVAVVVAFFVFQMATSDRVALAAAKAHEASPEEEPELHAMVDRLCALADMPKPRVAVIDSPVPNAFAAGRSRRGVVLCVTRGLRERLDDAELEGVLAHELSHIAHGDAVVMTVASFVGVLAGLTARVGARLMYFAGRARNLWQFLAVAFAVTVLSAVTWFVSLLLIRALSRYREFAADRAAALLTGNPGALGSALNKVSGAAGMIPHKDLRRATALNAFYFCPVHLQSKPQQNSDAEGGSGSGKVSGGHSVFSTHPSVEARLERLARISADLSH
jgi:heat shock protein HtpX